MKLSVVIAAFDAARFVGPAIDSVLRELPRDAEVVVVDDGSRDETGQILAGYGARLRVLRNDAPSGPGAARNRGAAVAQGEVLAFHDADDLVLPGRFAVLQAVLDARPEVDLAFANGMRCDPQGAPLGPIIGPRHARRLARDCGLREMLRGGVVYPQATCVRREAFAALGGFASERAEDWDLALRASLRLRLAFVDVPVFAYRQNPDSVTARRREFGEILVRVLENFVATHPEAARQVPERVLREAVASQLARCARLRDEAGDSAGAVAAWTRAVTLAPRRLRYRLRRWQAARGVA